MMLLMQRRQLARANMRSDLLQLKRLRKQCWLLGGHLRRRLMQHMKPHWLLAIHLRKLLRHQVRQLGTQCFMREARRLMLPRRRVLLAKPKVDLLRRRAMLLVRR